ncbi:hypothetical protein NQZ68_022162 [Dissostichus eleginoides]|nr:hypothetical protein NQZ68_022162 [Dissostichus eleginoides]
MAAEMGRPKFTSGALKGTGCINIPNVAVVFLLSTASVCLGPEKKNFFPLSSFPLRRASRTRRFSLIAVQAKNDWTWSLVTQLESCGLCLTPPVSGASLFRRLHRVERRRTRAPSFGRQTEEAYVLTPAPTFQLIDFSSELGVVVQKAGADIFHLINTLAQFTLWTAEGNNVPCSVRASRKQTKTKKADVA